MDGLKATLEGLRETLAAHDRSLSETMSTNVFLNKEVQQLQARLAGADAAGAEASRELQARLAALELEHAACVSRLTALDGERAQGPVAGAQDQAESSGNPGSTNSTAPPALGVGEPTPPSPSQRDAGSPTATPTPMPTVRARKGKHRQRLPQSQGEAVGTDSSPSARDVPAAVIPTPGTSLVPDGVGSITVTHESDTVAVTSPWYRWAAGIGGVLVCLAGIYCVFLLYPEYLCHYHQRPT